MWCFKTKYLHVIYGKFKFLKYLVREIEENFANKISEKYIA